MEAQQPEAGSNFDAIVIGSGIGGLAAASVLTQVHRRRVLLLERHNVLGGFTHTFQRKGYVWDVGLHYVGQMDPADSLRRAFDFITRGEVAWRKMKSPFEVFCYPGFRFEVPDDRDDYLSALKAGFPREAVPLERYFRDIDRIPKAAVLALVPRPLRAVAGSVWRGAPQLAQMTVSEYLRTRFADTRLRAILASQWGDYGLPPSQASMLIHATIVSHYLAGGYYPEGGAGAIAESVGKVVQAGGGRVLLSTAAVGLEMAGGRAVGVRVVDRAGEERVFKSSLIFSDIGAEATHRLIPEFFLSPGVRAEIGKPEPGISAVGLFLGLKASPATLGIHGQNFWLYEDWDHERVWRESARALDGNPLQAYVSFPSLKDPSHRGGHTAEVLAFVPYSAFDKWRDSAWRRRPVDYERIKEATAEGLLALVDKHLPGLSRSVDHRELSTPLTVEHFTHHAFGRIYGMPATPGRLHSRIVGPKTPVRGLFQVGSDVIGHGIAGSAMGGILAVAMACGWSTMGKVMSGRFSGKVPR